MKIYLAGPIRGKPNFNADSFRYWAKVLRLNRNIVFSPIEHTEKVYGQEIYNSNPDGDEERAGIDQRVVFKADLDWICEQAEAIALMPGWQDSRGATAERAVGIALGLKIIEL